MKPPEQINAALALDDDDAAMKRRSTRCCRNRGGAHAGVLKHESEKAVRNQQRAQAKARRKSSATCLNNCVAGLGCGRSRVAGEREIWPSALARLRSPKQELRWRCVRHRRLLPPADDDSATADERQHRARHRRERGDPELQPPREHPADALVAAARDVHAARPLGGARRARQPAVARARGVHRARDEETVRRAVRRQEAPPPRPRPSQRQVLCRRALRRRRRAHEERGARPAAAASTNPFSSLASPRPRYPAR